MGDASCVRGEPLVLQHVSPAHRLRQSFEHPVVGAGDGQPPPIRRPIVAVGNRPVGFGTHPVPPDSGSGVDGYQLIEHPGNAVVEGHVDQLAPTGRLPCPEGQQDAKSSVDAGHVVGEPRRTRQVGSPLRLTGEVGHAGEGLCNACYPSRGGQRTRAPIPADRELHEARVALPQHLEPEAPTLHGARAVVLDQDVRPVHQGPERIGTLVGSQVDLDAPLVPGVAEPPPRVAAGADGPQSAHGVAHARLLDLDHLGTELAQHRSCERPRQDRGRVHDAYPGQRMNRTLTEQRGVH